MSPTLLAVALASSRMFSASREASLEAFSASLDTSLAALSRLLEASLVAFSASFLTSLAALSTLSAALFAWLACVSTCARYSRLAHTYFLMSFWDMVVV